MLQIDQARQVNKEGTDPLSGLPYFESSIPIQRQEVEGYIGFDGFQCECYASSGEGSQAVKSDSATVKIACKSGLRSSVCVAVCVWG